MSLKKIKIILLLEILIFNLYHSQGISFPFGVLSPIYWIESREENKELILKEHIQDKILGRSSLHLGKKINQSYGFPIDGNSTNISFNISSKVAGAYSIFMVYELKNSQDEQNLWFLSRNESVFPIVAATNYRLADFTGDQYRSYPSDKNKERVKIHYYQHYKHLEIEEKSNYRLHIGDKSSGIPSLSFEGYISEVLIYDRVLSGIEMQQVASYLSLKYGVSLHQNQYKNYYNGQGDKIWDYEGHKEFNQNITGLGKHSNGNLYQMQSINSNDEQVVAMNIKPLGSFEIPENYFVFWSDNGKSLEIEKQREGRPLGVSRVWNLDFNPHKDIVLNWGFNARNIKLGEGVNDVSNDYYWQVVDTSGKGNFSPDATKYIRLNKITDNQISEVKDLGKYLFADNLFPVNSSKNLAYSIWIAPEMFVHLEIKEGKCQKQELSGLKFNMIGGDAPYEIRMKSLDQNLSDQVWTEMKNKGERILNFPSGRYIYEVKDAKGRRYEQALYLTDQDAPKAKLNKEYLIGKESIVLDISKELPQGEYSYEWYRNNKLISQNSSILLDQSGSYELRLKNAQGCHWVSNFKAYDVSSQDLSESKIVLYPNPSIDGNFKVLASFPKSTSGVLSIYNLAGRLVSSASFYNVSQYEYNGHIGPKGVYMIHLKTNLGENSYKLIVK